MISQEELAELVVLAQEQLYREDVAAAVQAQVLHLRARRNRSLWQRLVDSLPFTLTFHWKTT